MIDRELLDVLACPWCMGRLDLDAERLVCVRCRAAYRIENDIPDLVVEDADIPCPFCGERLRIEEGLGRCGRCGRRYDLARRPAGDDLVDHGRLFCPACGGALAAGETEAACAGCGKRYPVESGVAQTLVEKAY